MEYYLHRLIQPPSHRKKLTAPVSLSLTYLFCVVFNTHSLELHKQPPSTESKHNSVCKHLIAPQSPNRLKITGSILTIKDTYPKSGPVIARSNTWTGFSQYFNLRRNLTPYNQCTCVHVLLTVITTYMYMYKHVHMYEST